MARTRDRWGEDDDDDDRPRRSRKQEGISPVAIVLIVLVGVFFLAAIGGVLWLGNRNAAKARTEEAEAERAAADARRQVEELNRAVDDFDHRKRAVGPAEIPDPFGNGFIKPIPEPKPGFRPAPEPPPQPKRTAFATDDPLRPNHWRIFFRSDKPALWNTNTQDGDDFAIPLSSLQFGTKYLRLRRMDTGEAIIIPMTIQRVGYADPPGTKVRWNGEGKDEHGGYHLGIAEGPIAKFLEGKGTIGVLMDGWDANPGSGFGHAHHIDSGGQRFSWMGKEIPATVFEIAVTVDGLTEQEEKWLRK
jgi:hypothetical protein